MTDTHGVLRAGSRRWAAAALLIGILLSVSMSTGVLAADPPAEHDAHGAEEHPPEGPITAHKRDVDLALWSFVTFIVFVVVLRKYAWGPMIEGLDKRETRLLQHVADAQAAKNQAEKLLAAHAEKLDKVQDEIREILAEARRDADHAKTEIIATAQKEAEATKQRAVQEIERARDQALDDLFAHMTRSVQDATEKVIGRSLSDSDHQRLIAEALGNVTNRQN